MVYHSIMNEREFTNRIKEYFGEQEEEMVQALSAYMRSNPSVNSVRGFASSGEFDNVLQNTHDLLHDTIFEATEDQFVNGWKEVESMLEVETPGEESSASEEAAAAAMVASMQIENTTRNDLVTTLNRALMEAGVGAVQNVDDNTKAIIMSAIGSLYLRYRMTRTPIITATQIKTAVEMGKFVAASFSQAVLGPVEKYWENQQDDRVEQVCIDNTNDGWIPVNQLFSGGVMHPLQHVGCRCWLTYRQEFNE